MRVVMIDMPLRRKKKPEKKEEKKLSGRLGAMAWRLSWKEMEIGERVW